MIKVIIFDADGVLINGERFSVALERDYGISLETTLPFFNGEFQECLVGNKDLKQTVSPYLPIWGWTKDIEAFIDYWFSVEHSTNEELIRYIQDLRNQGVLCFLATNNEKYRFQYMLEKMGFVNCFDKTYASAHLGHKKPSQEFFLKIFNELEHIQKNEILFVDDTEENVKSAEDFGFYVELYNSFESFKTKLAFLK